MLASFHYYRFTGCLVAISTMKSEPGSKQQIAVTSQSTRLTSMSIKTSIRFLTAAKHIKLWPVAVDGSLTNSWGSSKIKEDLSHNGQSSRNDTPPLISILEKHCQKTYTSPILSWSFEIVSIGIRSSLLRAAICKNRPKVCEIRKIEKIQKKFQT